MSTEMMLGFFVFCSFSLLFLFLGLELKRRREKGEAAEIESLPDGIYRIIDFFSINDVEKILLIRSQGRNREFRLVSLEKPVYYVWDIVMRKGYIHQKRGGQVFTPPE